VVISKMKNCRGGLFYKIFIGCDNDDAGWAVVGGLDVAQFLSSANPIKVGPILGAERCILVVCETRDICLQFD